MSDPIDATEAIATIPANAPEVDSIEVHLREVPLGLLSRTQQHADALLREFALIAAGTAADQRALPLRLLQLVDELQSRFGPFTADVAQRLSAAAAAGESSTDVTYRLPMYACEAAIALAELFDEADQYCAAGTLLTLVTPPTALSFRRWYFHEIIEQLQGARPVAWPDWVASEPQ